MRIARWLRNGAIFVVILGVAGLALRWRAAKQFEARVREQAESLRQEGFPASVQELSKLRTATSEAHSLSAALMEIFPRVKRDRTLPFLSRKMRTNYYGRLTFDAATVGELDTFLASQRDDMRAVSRALRECKGGLPMPPAFWWDTHMTNHAVLGSAIDLFMLEGVRASLQHDRATALERIGDCLRAGQVLLQDSVLLGVITGFSARQSSARVLEELLLSNDLTPGELKHLSSIYQTSESKTPLRNALLSELCVGLDTLIWKKRFWILSYLRKPIGPNLVRSAWG